MRFYAVCTEAIQLTHRALQQLDQGRRGSRLPSRALRVATLYGHLQTRANAAGEVRLTVRDLATAWNLQPRLLRDDINDLQALGWLSYRCDWRGTVIRLNRPELPSHSCEPADAVLPVAAAAGAESPDAPEPLIAPAPATPAASPAADSPEAASPSAPDQALMARFCEIYNQHRPQAWPAYHPRGTALAPRVRRVIRHVGGAETFWPLLARALKAMPEFWRCTYPQGRSGADCAAALLSADRNAAGLGPDFWHVLSWAAAEPRTAGVAAGAGGVASAATPESDLQKAQRLLFWSRDHWHGSGIEAAKLDRCEKRRLAELLEAQGEGRPGTAAEQFSQPPKQH